MPYHGAAAGGIQKAWRRRQYCRRDCTRFQYWHRLHDWWQGLLLIPCWALLGPQLGFLLIPCCSDWSADGLGKPDVVASEVLRDVRPPLRGPRLEDQLPVAPVTSVSTLASMTWICRFEPLKHADGAFFTRSPPADVSLHPARAAVPEACPCVQCAVEAAPPALILVPQNVGAPLARHRGGFQVDE